MPKGADRRLGTTVAERGAIDQAPPARRAADGLSHLGLHRGFIDEGQPFSNKSLPNGGCAVAPAGALRPEHRAAMEQIPPPKPRLDEDALSKTAGTAPHSTGLRPPTRGLQVRIAVLNGYTALGIPVTEAVA